MGGIFISYRGADSDTAAALIDRELAARFGSDRVFLDSRSIPAGADFVEELLGRLRACSVLLVVIGPRWLTLTDAAGQRRIDDPRDWIRREIVEALACGLRIIPVLTGDILLPVEADLPGDIAGLSRRQFVPLRRRYTAVDLAFLAQRITEADPELANIAALRQSSAGQVSQQLPAAFPAPTPASAAAGRPASQHARRTRTKPGRAAGRLSRIGWLQHRRTFITAAAVLVVAAVGTVLAINAAPGGNPSVTDAPTSPAPRVTSAAPTPAPRPTPQPLGQPLPGSGGAVTSVAFSRDGRILANGNAGGAVQLWDVTDPSGPSQLGNPVQTNPKGVESVALSPDRRILANGNDDGTVQLWDVTNPSAPSQLGKPLRCDAERVYTVAFSPDGKTLATGELDNTARLWDVTNPSAPRQLGDPLEGHNGAVASVAFSRDGRILATASFDGTVRLWDTGDPAHHQFFTSPQTGSLYAVAFSPDRKTLASGDDGTVRLWDVAGRQLGDPLQGHNGVVYTVAFSPDGKTLASGGSDHTVRLWDVTDPAHPRRLGAPLQGHADQPVSSVAFSPDGKTLASGGYDGKVQLWALR